MCQSAARADAGALETFGGSFCYAYNCEEDPPLGLPIFSEESVIL